MCHTHIDQDAIKSCGVLDVGTQSGEYLCDIFLGINNKCMVRCLVYAGLEFF